MQNEIRMVGPFSDTDAEILIRMMDAAACAMNVRAVSMTAPAKYAERWVDIAPAQNSTVKPSGLKIDSDVAEIIGIRLDSLEPAKLVLRGKIGINISGKEAIKEGYMAKGLYSSESVDPNRRHYAVGLPIVIGSRDFSIVYEDQDNAAAVFGTGYTVRLVMLVRLN